MINKQYLVNYWLPQISPFSMGERGGSVVECRTPEREVLGSRPTAAVLCPWARHFTPRKYWLITQEAMAPSRHDWKIVDWDVKPQHNQPTNPVFYKVVETWGYLYNLRRCFSDDGKQCRPWAVWSASTLFAQTFLPENSGALQ